MTFKRHWFEPEEAAALARIDSAAVRYFAECGLIAPGEQGYGAGELAELRRARRLLEDLELDHGAVEVVLRLRMQVVSLQAEVRRLERALRRAARPVRREGFSEADWSDA